jgi:hypothetical protein
MIITTYKRYIYSNIYFNINLKARTTIPLVLFFDINDFLKQQIIKNLDIWQYAVFNIYKDLQKASKLKFILVMSLT